MSNDRADALALRMTSALQRHSKTTLLGLFSGASAKAAASIWYDNVNAIGFTTAAVGRIDAGGSPLERTTPRTQLVTVAIGLHNKFDESLNGEGPDTPATRYDLNTDVVHDKGDACHLTIASWKSENNAPWDSGKRLTVVHTAHTVVAGDSTVASDVNKVARLSETAADYVFKFYKSLGAGADINLHGFLVFVPKSVAQNNSWFVYKDEVKPSGWTADVGRNAAGVEYPLFGAQLPAIVPAGVPKPTKVSLIGGGRVVITRTGVAEPAREQTATLVHEFTHDIYNNYDAGWFTGQSVDAALAEGAARYVETFYRINPNPNAKNVHTMTLLEPELRPRFGSFNGRVPTRGQIYGSGSTANFYYDLSATCFTYLASKYGAKFAFQSIRNAYANSGGPFSGIVTSTKGGTITFAAPGPYQTKWAAWLRSQV
jgi:hypothetical protein